MRRSRALAGAAALTALLSVAIAHATVTPLMYVDPTEKTTLPASVLSTVGQYFPERVHVGQTLLSDAYDPNLVVSAPTKLRISFVAQGAGYRSALGYFTYTSTGSQITIVDRSLVFPDATGSPLPIAQGDTVTLRDSTGAERIFQPGQRIGFFLVSNGWNGSSVAGWSETSPSIPSSTPHLNEVAGNGGWASGIVSSLDAINPENWEGHPELARHAIIMQLANVTGAVSGQAYWVLSFEDMIRTNASCDNDFNDVIFQIQAMGGAQYNVLDNSAIANSEIVQINAANPDPDGDGVSGLTDAFPNDATRAFVVTTPATGLDTLAFEDLYPRVGDADYNDAVVQYAVDEVLAADSTLKQVVGTYHLIARGAGYDSAFGVALHGLPAGTTGTVQLESFAGDGTETLGAAVPFGPSLTQEASGSWMLRIDNLFPSTRAALPPSAAEGGYTNTWFATPTTPPASVRFLLTFDHSIAASTVGLAPFDPYLLVKHTDGDYDIH
ncbi:MAG TPA: LruC domain-containing protein, partial [Polyangiaceae bacterium]|nr:LruC domain-containing protein [Polyangiaceae bacterium]